MMLRYRTQNVVNLAFIPVETLTDINNPRSLIISHKIGREIAIENVTCEAEWKNVH